MGKRSDPAVLRLYFPKEKWDVARLRELADVLRVDPAVVGALDGVPDGQSIDITLDAKKARALARAFDALIHAVWRVESMEKQVRWAWVRSKMRKKAGPAAPPGATA